MRRIGLVPFILLAFFAIPRAPLAAEEAPKVAGEEVPAPKRTKLVRPEYPDEARAKGIHGIVTLELIIDTAGHVASVQVVKGIPGLDEAALSAVRKWEYEITRLNGKPVSVRLTVPISFLLSMPKISRQEGIPELRQGATPEVPAGASLRTPMVVTAEITLGSDGKVTEIQIQKGEAPFAQAVARAVQTWAFAPQDDNAVVSFRLEATFSPEDHGGKPRLEISLGGLHKSLPVEAAETAPKPPEGGASAPPSGPPAAPTAPLPQTPGATPGPSRAAPPPEASPLPPAGPPPSRPPAQTTAPSEETLAVPTPPPPPALPPEAGASAIRDVTLEPGVPELVKGRRPVVPPLARVSGLAGEVQVRFRVDAAGATLVTDVQGPEALKAEAEQAVASWSFRRTRADRLALLAVFNYKGDSASAVVRPVE
jgi:TonB family protein